MNNIPEKLKLEIKYDPFYEKCCLEDENCSHEPGHRAIEWHHVIIFAGRQVQLKAFIVPACSGYHHKYADRKDIKERFVRIAVTRATVEELKPFCKAVDYIALKEKYES